MIITILGTRPQFIKASVLSHALRQHKIAELVIDTRQHYSSTVRDNILNSLPYRLPLHGEAINGLLQQPVTMDDLVFNIELQSKDIIQKAKAILVYGDTNSTLAGALVAAKYEVKLIHAEAGQRSFNDTMPEERNRITVDYMSNLLFCVNTHSKKNLHPSLYKGKAVITGDLMLDASLAIAKKVKATKYITLAKTKLNSNQFVYFTLHRVANTENFKSIQEVLNLLAKIPYTVLWVLHPRVLPYIKTVQIPANIVLHDSVSYTKSIELIRSCRFVLTDSGGLQREAYWLQKKCITLREETEWKETLWGNWNMLLNSSSSSKLAKIINTEPDKAKWSLDKFGSGKAAENMIAAIKKYILS